MKFVEVFRIYNLKFIKKNKINTVLTILALFLCLSVCLVTPVINYYYEKNINENIIDINGGDLAVFVRGNESQSFKDKVKEKEDKGLKVTEKYITSTGYMAGSKQIAGRVIFEDNDDLKNNEVIISENLAEELKASKGDTIKFKVNGNIDEFKVKNIEVIAKGVDSDCEALGFGRVNLSVAENVERMSKFIYITGEDGESLKEEFKAIDEKNQYVSLSEKQSKMKSDTLLEITVLNLLSSVSLILTLLSIVFLTFMNILKRKRDICVLKLISVKNIDIEKAMFLEMTLVILVPLIMALIICFPLAKLFLQYKGMEQTVVSMDAVFIILKGFGINLLVSWACTFLALRLCNKIKPIDIMQDDTDKNIKIVGSSIIKFLLLLPIVVVIYGVINKDKSFIGAALGIMAFILIFLLLSFILIKIAARIPYRNNLFLYTFKNIKKNSIIFIFTVLSLTVTCIFILAGYYLKDTISENMNEVVKNSLPYNYEIIPDNSDFNDEGIVNSDKIEGYNKIHTMNGELLNSSKASLYKSICIDEINEEDYKAKFNICEGQDLFEEGDGNIIISDDMADRCHFEVGDIVDVKYEEEVVHLKVKGVYDSAGINEITMYKENKELSKAKKSRYYVKSKDTRFMDDIDNCLIWSLNDAGKRMTEGSINKFLKVFKILSIITVISIVIVNINITNMAESLEKKNNEIIMALGMGKGFIFKSRIIKIISNSILASILSVGVFSLIINLWIAAMFKQPGNVNIGTVLILSSLSLVFSLLSYIFNLRVYDKSFDLIRVE